MLGICIGFVSCPLSMRNEVRRYYEDCHRDSFIPSSQDTILQQSTQEVDFILLKLNTLKSHSRASSPQCCIDLRVVGRTHFEANIRHIENLVKRQLFVSLQPHT